MDVRTETGIETYVNDEPGDPNPGVIIDADKARGRALTARQTRALALELLSRAAYLDEVYKVDVEVTTSSMIASLPAGAPPTVWMLLGSPCEGEYARHEF